MDKSSTDLSQIDTKSREGGSRGGAETRRPPWRDSEGGGEGGGERGPVEMPVSGGRAAACNHLLYLRRHTVSSNSLKPLPLPLLGSAVGLRERRSLGVQRSWIWPSLPELEAACSRAVEGACPWGASMPPWGCRRPTGQHREISQRECVSAGEKKRMKKERKRKEKRKRVKRDIKRKGKEIVKRDEIVVRMELNKI